MGAYNSFAPPFNVPSFTSTVAFPTDALYLYCYPWWALTRTVVHGDCPLSVNEPRRRDKDVRGSVERGQPASGAHHVRHHRLVWLHRRAWGPERSCVSVLRTKIIDCVQCACLFALFLFPDACFALFFVLAMDFYTTTLGNFLYEDAWHSFTPVSKLEPRPPPPARFDICIDD